MRRSLALACLAGLAACLAAATADASPREFPIDLHSTSQFRMDLTTALVDTAAGVLTMPPYVMAESGHMSLSYAEDVTVVGRHAYVAGGTGDLQILDICDPSGPTLAASYVTPGFASGVAVAGGVAVVADGSAGFQVVDVDDPTAPAFLSSYNTAGNARDCALAGSLLFVADGVSGLRCFDLSDPGYPKTLDVLGTTNAYAIALHGDLLLLADFEAGLRIVDVSDPEALALVATLDTPGYARDVAVAGGLACVADDVGGLRLIDISDPAHPSEIASLATGSRAFAVDMLGTRAYVADDDDGLVVCDMTDPASPSILQTTSLAGDGRGLDLATPYAIVAAGTGGLRVVRVSQLSAHDARLDSALLPSSAKDIVVLGDVAWVGCYDGEVATYGLDPSGPPVPLDDFLLAQPVQEFAPAGDVLYAACGALGLVALSAGQPDNIGLRSATPCATEATGVAVAGDLACVVCDDVELWDVSDPDSPKRHSTVATTGTATDAAVEGNRLYTCDDAGRIQILDIGDPSAPVLLGDHAWSSPLDIFPRGDRLLVHASGTMLTLDVSDPASPLETHSGSSVYDNPQWLGTWLFSEGGDFINVHDYANPDKPAFVDQINYYLIPMLQDFAAFSPYHVLAFQHSGEAGWESRLCLARSSCDEWDLDATAYTQTLGVTDEWIYAWRLDWEGDPSIFPSASLWGDDVYYYGFDDGAYYGGATYPSLNFGDQPRLKVDFRPLGPRRPEIRSLSFVWAGRRPWINGVVDVPDDQGGRVRLRFAPSGTESDPWWESDSSVTEYSVWRRLDEPLLQSADAPPRDGPALYETDGTPLSPDRVTAAAEAGFPDGAWECLRTIPSVQQPLYWLTLDTLADSTAAGDARETFCVVAHTAAPRNWYVSDPDSGYSVDNLAPNVPEGLMVDYAAGGNCLEWLESADADFRYFKIYRGSMPDFAVDPENPVQMATSPSWTDPAGGWDVFYKVSAVDFAGNESPAAMPGGVTAAGGPPPAFRLLGAAPNPFNPRTTISFELPETRLVDLRVYDAAGRLVRTLLSGETIPAGRRGADWDGRDASGRTAPSGVYFYRLTAGADADLGRMLLLK